MLGYGDLCERLGGIGEGGGQVVYLARVIRYVILGSVPVTHQVNFLVRLSATANGRSDSCRHRCVGQHGAGDAGGLDTAGRPCLVRASQHGAQRRGKHETYKRQSFACHSLSPLLEFSMQQSDCRVNEMVGRAGLSRSYKIFDGNRFRLTRAQ